MMSFARKGRAFEITYYRRAHFLFNIQGFSLIFLLNLVQK